MEYLYTDSTDINSEIASELLILADKYLVNRLKNCCEDYLTRNLSIKNIVEMTNLAEMYKAKYLKEYSLNFIVLNKNIICETQDISKLSKEVLVELFRLRK